MRKIYSYQYFWNIVLGVLATLILYVMVNLFVYLTTFTNNFSGLLLSLFASLAVEAILALTAFHFVGKMEDRYL